MTKQGQASRHRFHQRFWSTLLILVGLNLSQPVWAAASKQDLEAIVRTRDIALQAINSRDFSKIEPFLHPAFTITTVDNRIFHHPQEFEQYWNQQFTEPIKNIAFELTGETTRTFLSADTEVAYGEATSTFYFTDGNVGVMPLRWTAVLQKVQGTWMIQTLHFSSNLLDNPVLHGAQMQGRILAIASGIGGLLVGAIAVWLLRRRSNPAIQPSSPES